MSSHSFSLLAVQYLHSQALAVELITSTDRSSKCIAQANRNLSFPSTGGAGGVGFVFMIFFLHADMSALRCTCACVLSHSECPR